MGYDHETLMKKAKELLSIDSAYDGHGAGGYPKSGAVNRAAWSNDRRMAQTPLGPMRAPPKAGGPRSTGGSGGGSGGVGSCELCGGVDGHKKAQCPVYAARKDEKFMSKSELSRKKRL